MITLRSLFLCVIVACLIVIGASGPAAALDLAGTVVRLQGTASATGSNGFSRPLQEGSTVLVGDRLATSSDSRLQLRMKDGAVVTLGRNSELTIEAYTEDESLGRAALNVIEGTFLATSGAIAKLGPDRFTVTTPVATLGVRGTDVWGEQSGERLAVAMLSGEGVQVSTPQGSVELTTPESGVDVVLGEAPPAPKTWSPSRLEAARASVSFD